MRKEQMIRLIYETVDIKPSAAEYLLMEMEKAGMIPPAYYIDRTMHLWNVKTGTEYTETWKEVRREWEADEMWDGGE